MSEIPSRSLVVGLARFAVSFGSILLLAPAVTLAQADPPIVEDEVTVTAQRVEQKLQDVPISLLALDADELAKQSVSDMQELADSAPALVNALNVVDFPTLGRPTIPADTLMTLPWLRRA